MPGYANLVFLEQENLLTLLQSTQLYIGNLVVWCHPGKQPTQLYNIKEYLVFTWEANAQTVLVSNLVVLGLLLNFWFRDLSS